MSNTDAAAKANFLPRVSRVALCAVLIASLICAVLQGTARADTATSSVTGNDFISIVIRQGSADGTVVATLVGEGATPTAAAALVPDVEYYLCATVKKTSESTSADYVKLVVGDGAEGSLAANGLNITNPPGGSARTIGEIDSNSFDYLLSSSEIADGTYGTDYNNGSPKTGVNTYKMADGIWEWRLKSSVATGDTYSFNIGFKVDGAFCTGANKDIADALNLSVGSLSGAQGTTDPAIANTSDTLSLGVAFSSSAKAKNPYISLASTGIGISSGTSSMGYNSYGFYPAVNSTADPQSLLYKSFEFDIVHPVGTAVSYIGFANDGLVKSSYNTARGAFSHADTGTDVNGNIITHVTLSPGLVSSSAQGFYYQMTFDDTINIGDKPTVTFQNYKATGFDGSTLSSTLTSTCVFTIVDPALDATALGGTSRAIGSKGYGGTYNWNIGRSSILAYNELLTEGNLSNPTSSKTPYKKTIRATYNTTAAAANISLATLPIGCESVASDGTINWLTSVTVNWEGKDASGVTKTGSFTIARTDARWRKDMETTGHLDYLKLLVSDSEFASDGIVTFTKMTVDAGYLPPNANTSSWTASNSYGANMLGAWGYFTDGNVGTQVKTYYECYNTESTAPINDKSTTVYTEANSLPAAALEANVGTPSDNFAITAGGTVSIGFNANGSAGMGYYFQALSWRPSSASLSNFSTLPSDSASIYDGYADTTLIVDPVVILKLPPGFTYSDLHFYKRVNGGASTSSEYTYTIQNISYLDARTEVDLAGWSLYKITFPADTIWGYYDIGGNYTGSSINIKFNTSESVETKQYYLDDLINVTCERNLYACGYTGTGVYTKADIFSINGGRQLAGVSAIGSPKRASFGVGQLTKLIVENSAALTSNNGTAVADPTWRTYSSTDPNSITFLGRGSTGQVKVDVSNPSSTDGASDFKMLIPIPKKDQDLGIAFMSGQQNYDMTLTPNAASFTGDNANFITAYVKITSDASTNTSISKVVYTECDESEANAILVTRGNYPASGSNTLLFDFKIADGVTISSGDRNVWRDAFSYTVGGQSIERTGSYVAAEVAASEVAGVVFNDANRNGLKDEGEAVVAGVAVTATDQQGRVQNTTTDENGSYTFEFVRNDKITVSLTVPADTSSSRLRFNVAAPSTIPSGVVGSTVTGSSDGKTATATVTCNDTTETANAAIAQSYSLTYNRNSKTLNKSLINDPAGSVPLAAEYPSGATATVAAPTNDMACVGYSFAGWATSATATTPDYVAGNTIAMTSDVTLYAVWSVNTYTIHFDYQGGTSASIMESKSWTYGTKLGTADSLGRTWPVNPTKGAWSFYKWEVADASAALGASTWYDGNSTRGVAGDIYMRAVYVQLAPTTLDESVTVGTTSTVDAPALDLATLATITNKEPKNTVTYTCTKVNGTAFNASTNTVPGMTLATTGKVYGTPTTPGTYTLVYTVETKSPNASFELTVNLTVTKNALGISVSANPTTVYVDGGSKTLLTAAVTGIPAGAADFTGRVTFTATKGSQTKTLATGVMVTNGSASYEWNMSEGDSGTWTVTATLSDYGENYSANRSSATCTVLATTTGQQTYTVVFDKNATDASGAMNDEPLYVSVAGNLTANAFERTGYAFAGWNTVAVPTAETPGTSYGDGVSVIGLGASGATITLHAQWKANTYTVRFDANTTDVVTGTMADEGFTYGTAMTLTANTFVRAGYTFAGWNTKADGTGTGYLDKASVNNLSNTDGATVTLYAQWTANFHLVTYDTKGGTQAETNKRVTYGSVYGTLPTPVKSGYDFAGWYTLDGSASGTWGSQIATTSVYSLDADSTIYAKWTEKTGYAVVYNTNGGTPATVESKNNVTWTQVNLLPDEPTRAGYAFGGWKIGSTLVINTTPYSALVSTDATKTVTLVAQWTADAHTVTFDANGGVSPSPATKSVTYGSIYGDLATTNRAGYAFAGWWTANGTTSGDWGTKVLSTSAYQVADDQTLYAKWTANTSTAYKVEHYKVSADGTSATSAYTENLTGTTDTTATATAQTFDGYIYQPSFDQSGMRTVVSGTIAGDGGLVLKLYYTPKTDTKYTVSYVRLKHDGTTQVATEADGTRIGTTGTAVDAGAIAAGKAYPGFAYDPAKATYADTGHATAQTDALPIAGDGSLVVSLYYVEAPDVVISYSSANPAGGSVSLGSEGLAPATGTAAGSTATANAGYLFVNWTDASGSVLSTDAELVPAKVGGLYAAATYTANFAIENYGITYDLAGGTATGSNPASYTVKSESFTLSNPTRAGYSFRGWTGTGIQGYSTSVTISKGSTGARAYTAVWEAITYDIAYKPGDHGTMTDASGTPLSGSTVTGAFDQLTPALAATLTAQAGYAFAGWKADDEAGTVYTEAQLAALKVTGAATYTAQWTANADTAYTVKRIRVKSDGFSDQIVVAIGKTGATGSAVDAAALAAEMSYAGYAYDSAKTLFVDTAHPQGSIDPLPIAGDGSLVVNLYYVEGANVRLDFAPDDASHGSVDWPQMYLAPATGEAFAVTATTKPGYSFSKWTNTNTTHATATDVPGATSSTITAAQIDLVAKSSGAYETTSFVAVFAENFDYTVAYDLNYAGAINPDSKTGVGWTDADLLPAAPARTGYAFGGWYATAACTGDALTAVTAFAAAAGGTEPAAKTVTLYAKWNADAATIKFAVNGGTAIDDMVGVTNQAISATTMPTTTRVGFAFGGWYANPEYSGAAVETLPSFYPTGTTTYYARWTASPDTAYIVQHYKVNANGTSASLVETESLKGSTDTQASANAKSYEGYTYRANYDQNDMKTVASGTIVGDGSLVLRLYYVPNSYVVKFEATAGSGAMANEPMTYDESKALSPNGFAAPAGWHFVGWATSEDDANNRSVAYGNQESVMNLTADNDATVRLWAVWTRDIHVVTFNKNASDAENPTPASGSYAVGLAFGDLAACARPGYELEGWYTAASGGTKVEATTLFSATADLTLYAHWTANTFALAYDTNGGDALNPSGKRVTYDAQVGALPTPARAGYAFEGWYTEASGGIRVTSDTVYRTAGDSTIHAHWLGQAAAIAFDSQGGSVVGGITGRTGDAIAVAFPADAPTMVGHAFAGWYTAASGGDKVTSYPAAFPVGTTTYYAHWTSNNYEVTFDSNGGSAVASQSVAYGSKVAEPSEPSRTGYAFASWRLGTATGSAYDFATPVTGPIVLVASWTPTSYDITYDLADGALAAGGTNPTAYTVGDTFTLSNPTRENYLFSGWTGTELSAATMKVVVGKGSIGKRSYTATWTAIDAKKTPVVYDGNGADSDVPTDATAYRSGDTVKISSVVPERTGFNFVGWLVRDFATTGVQAQSVEAVQGGTNLAVQASGRLFFPGDSFTMPAGAPIVLVAQWSVDSYLVSFNTGEGGSHVDPQTVKNGAFATKPSNPTRAGYEFTDWYTDATCTTAFNFATNPITGATTIVAGWKLVTYSIALDAGAPDATLPDGEPTTYTIASETFSILNPTRPHYTFAGWTGTDLSAPALDVAVQRGSMGNRIYKGTWAPAVYTVSFSTAASGEVPAQRVAYGATTAEPSVTPVRDGYTFNGWYADYGCTVPFDFSQAITGDATVWAGWTARDSGGASTGGSSSGDALPGDVSSDVSPGGSSVVDTEVVMTSNSIPDTGDPSVPGLLSVTLLSAGAALLAWGRKMGRSSRGGR